MPDLFDYRSYPARPGYREQTTSKLAAKAMIVRSRDLQARVLAAIATSLDGLTADECAAKLGESMGVKAMTRIVKIDRVQGS